MKIIDATQKLINHFLKHDSINEEQISTLIPEKEDFPSCNAAFVLALEELEKNGIISSKTEEIILELEGNKRKSQSKSSTEKIKFTTWVLKRPLQHREQILVLDGLTALKISAVVNNFYQFAAKTMICNPIQINNNDIIVLLEVIALYAKQNTNQEVVPENTKVDIKKKNNENE